MECTHARSPPFYQYDNTLRAPLPRAGAPKRETHTHTQALM